MKYYTIPRLNLVLPGVILLILASGCSIPGDVSTNSNRITEVSQTTNIPVPPVNEAFLPEFTAIDSVPAAQLKTASSNQSPATSLPQLSGTVVQEVPCNLASAGIPLDVTIPDNTRLEPNEPFSKVWRLINAGSCTWSTDYALVWFSGDDFGASPVQPVITVIHPGESVELAVDLIAPDAPGLYAGYWMVMSGSGELFGIGPNGNSPFWVRIQVIAVDTPTPTITTTPKPTSDVFTAGQVNLSVGQSFDLDHGEFDPLDQADGMLEENEEGQLQWSALNEGRFAIFGLSKPGELECSLATLSEQPISVSGLEAGIYLCYRTNDGLPGMMQIENLLAEESSLALNFTTWAVP